MLELCLLGTPRCLLNGQEVRPKTRKGLVLTTLLALEGEQSRDRLAALLWADASNARNSLRNALSSLRETFGDHLMADGHTVRLEVDRCDATLVLHGQEAAALEYRGVLLDGVQLPDAPEAQEWLEGMRHRLETAAIRSLEGLDTRLALEKLAVIDELNEPAQRRLMQLLAAEGNRAGALSVFVRLQNRLETRLGLRPEPETRSLAESLRLVETPASAPATGRVPSLPALLLESRLIGRVPEFQRLVAGFHAASAEGARVMALVGEPGIGKTRLAQEFLNWVRARAGLPLSSRAFEGAALAYQPITDVLRGLGPLESLLSDVWLSELARLLPELRETQPELPAPTEDEALGRSRVFEAVTRIGIGLCKRAAQHGSAVVWLLDDAQWADAASLELLVYVMRRAAPQRLPLLLVLTIRAEALGEWQPWLTGLRREVPLEMLDLAALSRDDTGRLLESLGLPLGPLLEWLFAETGGQPLFLAETLRSLAETGALTNGASGWRVSLEGRPALAPGVRAVIEARFSRLSTQARALIEAGAVLGQGFVFADACQVAQLAEAIEPLEELLRARILLELPRNGFDALSYAFSHDKLRETALEGLSQARAEALHRRALERQHGSAAQRAHHATLARDWQSAAHHGLKAAEASMHAYAWKDALSHLERVRALLQARPDGTTLGLGLSTDEIGALYGGLSFMLRVLGEASSQPFRHLASEFLEIAQALGDPRLEVNARLFQDATLPFDESRSRALLDQAQTMLQAINDQPGLFALEIHRTQFMRLHPQDMTEAISHLESLLPRAKALGREQLAWTLGNLADLNESHGNWQSAVDYWHQEIALQEKHPINDNTAYSLENLGFSLTNNGDLPEAIHNLREAYRIKREIDENPTWICMAGAYLSYALLEAGHTNEALEITAQAYELRHTAIPRYAAEYVFAHANALLETDPAAAAAVLEAWASPLQARRLNGADRPDDIYWVGAFREYFASHLCSAYTRLGDHERAAQHAQNALKLRSQQGNWRGLHAPRVHHWLEVRALLAVDDQGSAQALVAALKAAVRGHEPLMVNLALARHALHKSSLKTARHLALERGWVLRAQWLEVAAAKL